VNGFGGAGISLFAVRVGVCVREAGNGRNAIIFFWGQGAADKTGLHMYMYARMSTKEFAIRQESLF
jgi:hypothetical protein